MSVRARVLTLALITALGAVGSSCVAHRSAHEQTPPNMAPASRRMPDGRQWMTENLNVALDQSYCYEESELHCGRYGRLYTWDSAQRICQSLGNGWRLPTDDEWRQMAKHYGGVRDDSDDSGEAAYNALLIGGVSGFNAVLGGGRALDGEYARVEAHGFYWTATETDTASALFINFARGGKSLNRQTGGEKQRAFSVRCLKE